MGLLVISNLYSHSFHNALIDVFVLVKIILCNEEVPFLNSQLSCIAHKYIERTSKFDDSEFQAWGKL